MKAKSQEKIWVDVQGDLYQFDPPEDNGLMKKTVIYQELRLPRMNENEWELYFKNSVVLELSFLP